VSTIPIDASIISCMRRWQLVWLKMVISRQVMTQSQLMIVGSRRHHHVKMANLFQTKLGFQRGLKHWGITCIIWVLILGFIAMRVIRHVVGTQVQRAMNKLMLRLLLHGELIT